MTEAMFEVVLPDYFKKFQPNFKFVITKKIPNLSTFKNYAFGSHFKSEYCPFSVENEIKNHHHILIQVDSEEQLNQFFPSQKYFSVPCIFTCFKYLVSPAKDVKRNGELFDKLKLALTNSAQPAAANLDLLNFTAIKKRLPNFCFLQNHLTKKLHQIETFLRNLRPLWDRNELIIQLRLLYCRRQSNLQEFRLQFQRNIQKADMFKQMR